MVTLELQQLSVPPGHRVILHDVSWQEFEAILEELGDHRATRLAYSQGTLEMRMPLPKHEKAINSIFICNIRLYDKKKEPNLGSLIKKVVKEL